MPSFEFNTLLRRAIACLLLGLVVIGPHNCQTSELAPSSSKTYQIDASGRSKELLAGHLKMGTPGNPAGQTITANNLFLLRDGTPWLPVMGEIHFSRCPRQMWDDALLKAKAGGVDIIATYVFWNHHEEIQGQFDWADQRDLRAFLELCKKHGFYVLLRIGPWCHGEARNGGFPDWVQEMPRNRTDDPNYLQHSERLYREIYRQCRGLLFKEGGPIIGIQLENEYAGPTQHIVTLKEMARRVGFDVPLYTETGWGVEIPEDEVIPVYGGYADAPWTYGTQQLPPDEQFLFRNQLPVDVGIGTDVLPAETGPRAERKIIHRYPVLTAELGLGNQVFRTRRPIISLQDAITLPLVKLAGGANLIGYYTYHGGTNPVGKLSTLEEPGYPQLSYDFQTAISEFGETNDKYRASKLLHYWLQDFGHELAGMLPSLPQRLPNGTRDVDTLRFMARTKGRTGYLFLSNYQRYVENQDVGPQQIAVQLDGEKLTLPSRPFTMPKDATAVWPLNLTLHGAKLKWSTTQLICHVPTPAGETYFFAAVDGVDPEYVFDANTIQSLTAPVPATTLGDDLTKVGGLRPGVDCVIQLKTKSGHRVSLCTLSRSEALNLYRFRDLWGQPRVVIADGDVLSDGQSIDLRRIGEPCKRIWMCPGPAAISCAGKQIMAQPDDLFQAYSLPGARSSFDKNITISQQSEHPARWNIEVPPDALDDVYDVFLNIEYVGDIARIRADGSLLADHYYYGPPWRPGLRHWHEKALGKTLELTISSITPDTWCYLEPEARPDFSRSESIAEVKEFSALPQYRTVVRLEASNAKSAQ